MPDPDRPPRSSGAAGDGDDSERPRYTLYRTRPRVLDSLRRREPEQDRLDGLRAPRRGRGAAGGRGPVTGRRVVRWVLLAVAAWIGFSLVLFLVSAQIEQSKVSKAAESALNGGGPMPFSANTILVLGSDARPKHYREPGAGGPSRSDTIMLMRAGIGHSAKLSIPRDTVVDIPGHGRDKINAAYAIGGPALAITTIEQYLGIKINHLVEVSFENFPKFVDSLGGINYTGGCINSDISGGTRNGGFSLRLPAGTHHINGRQALVIARTRKNKCAPGENDIDRARHQQQILNAIKRRLLSPPTFFRLPWVSWTAPKAIRTDMGGPSLMGLFASVELGGSSKTRVLKPSGGIVLPNGGAGLIVSQQEKTAEVRRFLAG